MSSKDTSGTVKIGENITVDNGIISLKSSDIISALGYIPAKIGSSNESVYYADQLSIARNISGILFSGSNDIHNYAVCDTYEDAPIKEAYIDHFILTLGSEVIITFNHGNTCIAPQLNINQSGPRYIRYKNDYIPTDFLHAGQTCHFIFDGIYYQYIGDINTNVITGIKGNADNTYQTGYVNITPNNLGLDKVDNTHDAEKSVAISQVAINDKNNNDIVKTYFTNYEAEILAEEVITAEEEYNKQIIDYYNKYATTNNTIARLRNDILTNRDNIAENVKSIDKVNTYAQKIEKAQQQDAFNIDNIFDELSYIHEDLSSANKTATQGLTTATNVESNLTKTNDRITETISDVRKIQTKIESVGEFSKSAERDFNNRIIHETYAPIMSPTFDGKVQAPTPEPEVNNNQVATTAFVKQAISLLTSIDADSLQALVDIKKLLDANKTLKDGLLEAIASKQDKSDALLSISKLETEADQYLYTIGKDTYDTGIITKFARTILDDVTPYAVRQTINALGKDEQAVSAVEADTAMNCVGNSATADKLAIARRIYITDHTAKNYGDDTVFDGSENVRIKLPTVAIMNIEGNATTADHFRRGKELVVDVGSNARVEYTAEANTSLGVEGVLQTKNGGTGESDINKAWVGKSGAIEKNMDNVDNLIYATLDGDFFRVRIDKNATTNTGCLEIATGDVFIFVTIKNIYY